MVGRSLGLDCRVQQLGDKHFIGGLHFATDDSHNEQDSVTFLVPLVLVADDTASGLKPPTSETAISTQLCNQISDILDTCYKLNFQFQTKSGLPFVDLMIIASRKSQILC
jgi:hypothetical protein